jgi:hypothetical protein
MPEGDSVPIAKAFPAASKHAVLIYPPRYSVQMMCLSSWTSFILTRTFYFDKLHALQQDGIVVLGRKEELTILVVAMEHNIKGSAVGNQRDALEILDMAARGIVKTRLRVEKMENLTEVFREMSEGRMQGRVVLDLQ